MAKDELHTKPKRKKIFWACNHCNKAHITCEEARPCLRCIKKGLQDTCEDAPRKRKKYLADIPGTVNLAHLEIKQPPLSNTKENSELTFALEMMPSTKTGPGIGLQAAPHVFRATQFQHSNSLPNYLSREQGPAGNLPGPQVPLSLFSMQGYDRGFDGFPQGSGQPATSHAQHLTDSQNKMKSQAQDNTIHPRFQQAHRFIENSKLTQNLRDAHLLGQRTFGHQSSLPEQQAQQNHVSYMDQDRTADAVPEKRRANFLSSAADMEYATLSSILQDSFLGLSQTQSLASTEGTPASVNLSPALSPHGFNESLKVTPSLASTAPNNNIEYSPKALQKDGSRHSCSGLLSQKQRGFPDFPPFDARINQYLLGTTKQHADVKYPEVSEAMELLRHSDPALFYFRSSQLSLSFTLGFPPVVENSRNLRFTDPEEIYAKIKKPFSYTPGFHKLIAYLRGRFPREMLVKMAESMAVYRPSFIACTNSLRESDLIFMEQCFQRTLLTYDNFIKVSGTPTIVWRRTGEIAYVGHEFTTLTGWTQEHLLGGNPTFIVELLDDESVVEYFQLFSKIAFGDFLGATMTECTLLTPKQNVKIRAGCSWTMKRDVFGIPMMIVGNFLPIL